MLIQKNRQEKKAVEMVSLADLLSGKVAVENSKAPEVASNKGAIKALTCKDNVYTLQFTGAVDAAGNPSIWQTDKSVMLCWASMKTTVTRDGKSIPVKVSVNISLA